MRRASKEEGNVRLEVLQQHGRPDHFVLLETWKDQKALDAHGMATHTAQWREKLQPLRLSPFDERLHKGLALVPRWPHTPQEPRIRDPRRRSTVRQG